MLKISNLSKTYKNSNVKAIDDVSFEIEDGDIFGFIGPNGAGKSTTIKCIVGIHSFDTGDIVFNGMRLKDNPIQYKRDLAYVPDNPDIYEFLSGISYLDFIANCFHMGQEKNEIIHKYATLFNIEKDLANPIKTYSHGMKQKLQIIACIMHNPKLIVMDEPFVGLDPKASHDLKEVMRELTKQGTSILFCFSVLNPKQFPNHGESWPSPA